LIDFVAVSDSGWVMSTRKPISETELETLQRETFDYFVQEANSENGLIRDKTAEQWPASIAARGWLLLLTRLV
jgi:hypothetical protein